MHPLLGAAVATGWAALLVAGCSTTAPEPAPAPTPTASAPVERSVPDPAAEVDAPSPAEVAAARTTRLREARVRRTGRGLEVLTWWGCSGTGCELRGEVLVRHGPDGTTHSRLGSSDRWRFTPLGDHVLPVPGLEDLSTVPVASLAPGVLAVVGGGDGATLLPFQRAARSSARGSWTVFDVPLVAGERAYVSGQVVLPDGRLLVLLDHWSGDRPGRPSGRHHGLWVSDGLDWSRYSPFRVPGVRAGPIEGLGADPRRGGVLWVRTRDGHLLASTDGGGAFRPLVTGRRHPS